VPVGYTLRSEGRPAATAFCAVCGKRVQIALGNSEWGMWPCRRCGTPNDAHRDRRGRIVFGSEHERFRIECRARAVAFIVDKGERWELNENRRYRRGSYRLLPEGARFTLSPTAWTTAPGPPPDLEPGDGG
jgi:hypothetical protein